MLQQGQPENNTKRKLKPDAIENLINIFSQLVVI